MSYLRTQNIPVHIIAHMLHSGCPIHNLQVLLNFV